MRRGQKRTPNANEQLGVQVTDNWLLPDEGLGGNGIVRCAVCRTDSERADRFNGEAEDLRCPAFCCVGSLFACSGDQGPRQLFLKSCSKPERPKIALVGTPCPYQKPHPGLKRDEQHVGHLETHAHPA